MSNFTKIRYLGKQAGPSPYFGQATNIMYRFGITKREQVVDTRDVDGFLLTFEGRQPAFEVAETADKKIACNSIIQANEPKPESEPVVPTHSQTEPLDANVSATSGELTTEPYNFTVITGIGEARNRQIHELCIFSLQALLDAEPAWLAKSLSVSEKVVVNWQGQAAQL